MSEPMSAVEIEDVLSSIRRLVSEELRPLKRPAREAVARDDKLMLTPALRVVAGPEAETPPDHGAIIGRVADALAAEASFEAETGDPEPMSVAMPQTWEAEEEAAMVIDAVAEEAADDVARDEVARLETFVFHSRQAAVHPADEDAQDPGLDGEILDPQPSDASLSEPAWAQDDMQDDRFGDAAPQADHGAAPSDPQPEPALGPPEDPVWADAAEAEVMATLSSGSTARDQSEPARPAPTDDLDTALFSDDMQFDEAVLRDLVRDLIREELQGSLGERITRNVRKLVRAEVARALSLHDFE